jgi:hypothetical protein
LRLHVEREEQKRVLSDRGRGRADDAALLIHGHERALRVRGPRVKEIGVPGSFLSSGRPDRDGKGLLPHPGER